MSGRDVVRSLRERGNFAKAKREWPTDLLLALGALITVGLCGYLAFTTFLRPSAHRAQASAPMVSALAPDLLWTEQDMAHCDAAARQAATRPDSRIAQEAALGIRSITDGGYARLATRMNCIASTKVTRLCDPDQKVAFVAALNDYINRFDLVVLGLGAQNGIVSLAGGVLGGEAEMGASVMDIQTQATLDYIDYYHGRVVANLRELARIKLVSPDDFGLAFGIGTSGTILAMLRDVVPTHDICMQI